MKPLALFLAFVAALALANCRNHPSSGFSSPQGRPVAIVGPSESLPESSSGPSRETWDDTARFLAGLDSNRSSGYGRIRQSSTWKSHQGKMNAAFDHFARTRQQPIRSWSSSTIPDLQNRVVFYPFSGPDFLFAEAFFPRSSVMVLCGLESVESLPPLTTLSEAELAFAFENLRTSLNSVIHYSYFITKDMRSDFARTPLRGTLPVLMVFLVRTGHAIDRVESIQLDAAGNVTSRSGTGGAAPGFRITARSPRGQSLQVYYFQENLRNDGIGNDPRLLRFLGRYDSPVTYLKSASYLMHGDSFSSIRRSILERSQAVVTDPSGIPFRNLDPAPWDLRLYGSYTGTLDMFKEYYQLDLAAAYKSRPAGGMPFGVGYKQTSLMVARRTGPAQRMEPLR